MQQDKNTVSIFCRLVSGMAQNHDPHIISKHSSLGKQLTGRPHKLCTQHKGHMAKNRLKFWDNAKSRSSDQLVLWSNGSSSLILSNIQNYIWLLSVQRDKTPHTAHGQCHGVTNNVWNMTQAVLTGPSAADIVRLEIIDVSEKPLPSNSDVDDTSVTAPSIKARHSNTCWTNDPQHVALLVSL